MIYLITKNLKETQKLAGFLLAHYLKTASKKNISKGKFLSAGLKKIDKSGRKKARLVNSGQAIVIALEGELGAGKTTFVQGLAKELKIKSKIKSPTYNLLKEYKIPQLSTFNFPLSTLYHIDCYRLKNYKDLLPLDIKEILNNPKNLVLIEWSDRVTPILPKKHITIHIDHISVKKRKVTINIP